MAVEQINSNLKTEFHAKELSISVVSHFQWFPSKWKTLLKWTTHEEDTLIYAEVFYLISTLYTWLKEIIMENMGQLGFW